jgi:acyl carrier protein
LPRTTSGKIQRSLCRKKLLEGDLKIVAQWTAAPPRPSTAPTPSINGSLQPSPNAAPLSAAEVDRLAERVEARLLTWLAERTGASMDDVDPHKPLAEYGLDSLAVVEMSHELESWLHIRIPVIAAWNYPTPSLLARFLAQQASGSDAESSGGSEANTEALQHAATHSQSELEQLLAEIERLDDDEVQAALDDRDVKP